MSNLVILRSAPPLLCHAAIKDNHFVYFGAIFCGPPTIVGVIEDDEAYLLNLVMLNDLERSEPERPHHFKYLL